MLNKDRLTQFLLKARTKTYAGNKGQVKNPLLKGSKQLEYVEEDWLYRDIYNQGNGRFVGLETIYFKDKPIWSDSYFGNFSQMTEEEADKILRKALIDNAQKARIWHKVSYQINDYTYTNEGSGSIDEAEGSETIKLNGKVKYFLYYAGGLIG